MLLIVIVVVLFIVVVLLIGVIFLVGGVVIFLVGGVGDKKLLCVDIQPRRGVCLRSVARNSETTT